MTDEREPILDLDLKGNGGRVLFYNAEDARAFTQREIDFWNALADGRHDHPLNIIFDALQRLQGATTEVVRLSPESKTPDALNAWRNFQSVLEREYIASKRLMHSASVNAQTIRNIATERGRDAGLGALAVALEANEVDFTSIFRNAKMFSGAVEMETVRLGISEEKAKATQQHLATLLERQDAVWAEDRAAVDQYLDDLTRTMAELENDHRNRGKTIAKDTDQRVDSFIQAGEQEITRIQATEALFREQLKLKAPAEYWAQKAKDHTDRANTLRGWVIGAVVVGLALYAIILICFFDPLKAFLLSFKDDAPALFVVTGLVALAASIPIWFLRILVRFYVSEEHLASDAKERGVMTMTYLALSEGKGADEKDRAIILASLFRPSVDGIVKDAGGPDGTLGGLIAKLLDK